VVEENSQCTAILRDATSRRRLLSILFQIWNEVGCSFDELMQRPSHNNNDDDNVSTTTPQVTPSADRSESALWVCLFKCLDDPWSQVSRYSERVLNVDV
jgi:hypothetical protein